MQSRHNLLRFAALIFLTALSLCGCAKTDSTPPEVAVAGDVKEEFYPNGNIKTRWQYTDGKNSGLMRGYYESGELNWEVSIRNGAEHGLFKEYDKNGAVKREAPYVHGVIEGVQKGYYPTGELKWEIPVKNGIYDGVRKWYYKSGAVAKEMTSDRAVLESLMKRREEVGSEVDVEEMQRRFRHGQLIAYHENGMIQGMWNYQFGRRHGQTRLYDGEGRLRSVWHFEKDQPHGEYLEYYDGEKIKSKAMYEHGAIKEMNTFYEDGARRGYVRADEEGVCESKTFYTDGTLSGEEECRDGIRQGVSKKYYRSGKVYSVMPYVNHVPHGTEKRYTPDGKLITEIEYKDGQKDGFHRTYYAGGAVRMEVLYRADVQEGAAKDFDEAGKLVSESAYRDQKLHGSQKMYARDGRLLTEYLYEDGELKRIAYNGFENEPDGIFYEYYKDQKVATAVPAEGGNIQGTVRSYYLNRTLASEAQFAEGRPHGRTVLYGEDGTEQQESSAR